MIGCNEQAIQWLKVIKMITEELEHSNANLLAYDLERHITVNIRKV